MSVSATSPTCPTNGIKVIKVGVMQVVPRFRVIKHLQFLSYEVSHLILPPTRHPLRGVDRALHPTLSM